MRSDDALFETYIKLQQKYRNLVLKLLATRSAFTKLIKVDIKSTHHSVKDEQGRNSKYLEVFHLSQLFRRMLMSRRKLK